MATGLQPGGANGWPRLRTLAPAPRESRFAESVIPVADSAPKRYSTLTRRAALERGSKPLKRTPLRWKPRTTPYGGASAEFPNVGDFQAFIRRRDHQMCRACDSFAFPDVAHLLWKVGMGGRKRVSVNHPWNAMLLCRKCHRQQEVSRELTARLVRWLVATHGYALPERARRDLERIDAQYGIFEPDERDEYDPELSAVE